MQNLYKLANIFGLDADNTQHSIAIVDALNGINNQEEFIAYVREHKSSIEYVSKTEKLDMLAGRYKDIELDLRLKESYKKGDKYAVTLAKKVKECMNAVEENCCKWKHIKLDGNPFFEEHELRALDEVGSVMLVIEYERTAKLVDEISKLYKNKLKQKERKALAGGTQKDVLKLAKSAIKEM
jgi:hypothetical protein